MAFTILSEKSLIYFEGGFEHRIISLGEAAATEEQAFQDYILRELMSEGRICHQTVQKVDNEIRTITIEKDGPVALLVTTTKNALHPENETRMLSLEIDDSEKQTKAVLRKVAEIEGLNLTAAKVDFEPWRDFQRWLEAGECRVFVPYAKELSDHIPPASVRLRRDVGQTIRAIKAHALLHRDHRARDERGQIVADIDHDYATVRDLMNDLLAENSGVAVKPAMVETIEAVTTATKDMAADEGATGQDIAKLLKLDKSAGHRRLRDAVREGFVVNLETRRNQPGKYRTTGQKVEPAIMLPPADALSPVSPKIRPNRATETKNRNGHRAITVANPHATALQPLHPPRRRLRPVAHRLQPPLQPLRP